MNRHAATVLLVAAGLGFVIGFIWGKGTAGGLSAATTTDLTGGVLTVRVDTGAALKAGLGAFVAP